MDYIRQIEAFVPQCEQEAADQRTILQYIRRFPENILTRENVFAHITSSSLILNGSRTRILMIYHNIYRTWAWTGGHADGENDLLGVAMREACEETGLTEVRPLCRELLTLDVLPVFGHFKRGVFVSGHQHLNVSYALIADETAPLHMKPDENSGVRWFDIEDIPRLTQSEPYMTGVYRRLLERAGRAAIT